MRVTLDRAFVLRQPWAQAVSEGAFPALIRSMNAKIRGWVGILAASNPDPAGFRAEGDLPRKAIVGAVEIAETVPIEDDPRAFLRENFPREVAEFYPRHFVPEEGEAFAWLLERVLPADTEREWKETVPRTWARCNTWIGGEPVPLLEPVEA